MSDKLPDPWVAIAQALRENGKLHAENDRLRRAGMVVTGWREDDYPAHFDRWTAEYIADRYRAVLSGKGES